MYLSIIILTKLTALAVHYAITILLPRPRNKRELQVYYGLVVCTHRVAQWLKSFSKEAFLFSWSCTIHIIFALSLSLLLVMWQFNLQPEFEYFLCQCQCTVLSKQPVCATGTEIKCNLADNWGQFWPCNGAASPTICHWCKDERFIQQRPQAVWWWRKDC